MPKGSEAIVLEGETAGERWRVTVEGWEDVRMPVEPEPEWRELELHGGDVERILVAALRKGGAR